MEEGGLWSLQFLENGRTDSPFSGVLNLTRVPARKLTLGAKQVLLSVRQMHPQRHVHLPPEGPASFETYHS